MRKVLFAAAVAFLSVGMMMFVSAPASAQQRPIVCPMVPNVHVGGLYGQDCLHWAQNWRIPAVVVPGGRAPYEYPQRYQRPYPPRRFYPTPRAVRYGAPRVYVNHWHRRCFGDGHCICLSGRCPPQ